MAKWYRNVDKAVPYVYRNKDEGKGHREEVRCWRGLEAR